jgi:DNA replication and repair protein RecF
LQSTWLQALKIQGLRNISTAEFTQFSRVNIFHGANGAGKTSLLEAVHLLGLGRSFRGTKQKPMISYGSYEAVVYGEIFAGTVNAAQTRVSVGVRKDRNGAHEVRVGGQRRSSVAELAALLPLQVINADTFQLLLGAPALRRQFLDWGVFHVEHGFLELWRRLQRSLKQRNSLLRRGKISAQELRSWDVEFSRLAVCVTRSREQYFAAWQLVLLKMMERLWPEGRELEFIFFPGWDIKQDLPELLQRQLARDKEKGYTACGPHRADMRIRLQGVPVGEVLSRGQLKLLSVSMRLAQAEVLQVTQHKQCIFLVDDLPSELDAKKRGLLCELLDDLRIQLFVTSINKRDLTNSGFDQREMSMFHVEHGAVYQQ